MRILLLDIENAPNLAHVWKLWDENIGLNQLLESGYILSWAAKWLNSDEMYFSSINDSTHQGMLKGIHSLLNEADAVVHYNGRKHDIPHLNTEFVEAGMTPPSPYKEIDLITTVKRKFKFPSNRLAYVVKTLGLGEKIEHEGHTLWVKCMAGDQDAWSRMKEYNIHDVVLLERLYNYILPWIVNHPNVGIYQEDSLVCPSCGSKNFHGRGYAVTRDIKYHRFQCQESNCGRWFRGTKPCGPKIGEKFSAI